MDLIKTIENNNLFLKNEKIGVAVSGGIDSMCLLHYLNKNKDILNISILAITVNHCLRENGASDVKFVEKYCLENNIPCKSFKVDAGMYAKNNKLTIEEGARLVRYGVFDSLLERKIVDKICLAHHSLDQAETILLNLLRGTGLNGAMGMEIKRDNFVRPLLYTDKSEIISYAEINNIPYITDETNYNTEFARNFLRNEIFPQLKKRWPNVEKNLVNFGKICKFFNLYGKLYLQRTPMDKKL